MEARVYIDPGSGALTLQILMAGIAGALLVFRKKVGQVFAAIGHALGMRRK